MKHFCPKCGFEYLDDSTSPSVPYHQCEPVLGAQIYQLPPITLEVDRVELPPEPGSDLRRVMRVSDLKAKFLALEAKHAQLQADYKLLAEQARGALALQYIHTPHCPTCGSALEFKNSSPTPSTTLIEFCCPKGCPEAHSSSESTWTTTDLSDLFVPPVVKK
jgi:hypothetical protein